MTATGAGNDGDVVPLLWTDSSRTASTVRDSVEVQRLEPTRVKSSSPTSITSLNTPCVKSMVSPLQGLGRQESHEDPFVEKLHDQDDIEHMPRWKHIIYRLHPLSSIISLAAYWTYLVLRIKFTLHAQYMAHEIFYMAWLFLAVEMGVAFFTVLHQTWAALTLVGPMMLVGRKRPKLRLRGENVPTVDVFVTCCGEDMEILLDTVRAACDVDYPPDRFRVLVLDDGESAELRSAVTKLQQQQRYHNLHYAARIKIKGLPHHFKAGNLNYGLSYVHALDGGPGEYVAALDADMIPERDWLRAIMAHLVHDPSLAMACPPQLFYNVPKQDPLSQSQNVVGHVREVARDAVGVAWCTGSGYAMRRCALDAIGGFPTDSVAEDVYTSSLFLGIGWKTAFVQIVHEPLQFRTVPDTFIGHLKQRTRWASCQLDPIPSRPLSCSTSTSMTAIDMTTSAVHWQHSIFAQASLLSLWAARSQDNVLATP